VGLALEAGAEVLEPGGNALVGGLHLLLLALGGEGVEEEGDVELHGSLVGVALGEVGGREELGDIHVLLGQLEGQSQQAGGVVLVDGLEVE